MQVEETAFPSNGGWRQGLAQGGGSRGRPTSRLQQGGTAPGGLVGVLLSTTHLLPSLGAAQEGQLSSQARRLFKRRA